MLPAVFFLLRIHLAMQALFWFHMKFMVVFSSSVKKLNGSLMGIALILSITLGSIAIFTILILPNMGHSAKSIKGALRGKGQEWAVAHLTMNYGNAQVQLVIGII